MSDKVYKKYSSQKRRKTKAGKSFYIALAICLTAIGAATWSTFESIREYVNPVSETSSVDSYTEDNRTVNKNVSGFFDNQEVKVSSLSSVDTDSQIDTETETDTTVSEKEEIVSDKYLYPVGQNQGTAFSKDNLVYSETMGDWRVHLGTDFYADKGTKVHPITTGKVTEIYTDDLLGVTVVINHGNGVLAYYSGLGSTTLVDIGDSVGVGDYIGSINTVPCESLDEPHLHLGIKVDGEWVDPLTLLKTE